MYQKIAAVLGPRATAGIATSALPCAPVLAESQRKPRKLFRLGVTELRRRSSFE